MTGLENNRANLLLGLIIRQRPKRDFIPLDMNETARIIPETKPIAVSTKDTRAPEEDEKSFLSSLTKADKKEDSALNTTEDVDEPIQESFAELSASETNSQESLKPLRFLPGVLVGWGGELPPLPDLGGKPLIVADDTDTNQQAPKTEATTATTKSPIAGVPRERFVIKKKEAKPTKDDPELSSPSDASPANNSSEKDAKAVTHGAPVSLKDKPPDVSTDAFLGSLSVSPAVTETNGAASANEGNASLLTETEKGTSEGNPLLQTAPAHPNGSKPHLSGILKKSSAYFVNDDQTVVLQKDKVSNPTPSSPFHLPVSSSSKNEPVTLFHQGFLQLSQGKSKPDEENKTPIRSTTSAKEDPGVSKTSATVTQTVTPSVQEPPATSELKHDTVTTNPVHNSAAPIPLQQQQPCNIKFSPGPHTQGQNHSTTQGGALHVPPGPQTQLVDTGSEPPGQPPTVVIDSRHGEEQQSDLWERHRDTEDRDHGKHGHYRDSHHGKKSRHREREKKADRSYDDKHRERSRHHGHSDDRYGEKRRERQHSDDYSSRHKDKHRHRRDSDYENVRRSSKDSYSS